jgi:hypothetical protein
LGPGSEAKGGTSQAQAEPRAVKPPDRMGLPTIFFSSLYFLGVEIIEEQRKQYLRKSRNARNFRPFVAKNFYAKMLAKVRRKRGSGEICFTVRTSLFTGVRGVVSRNRLDMTIASFPEDVCSLRRSEGDVFLQEFKSFRGNGSSESTRFPKGLVLGNSVKALHPRNSLAKIREKPVG